jgi:hypothetical protein
MAGYLSCSKRMAPRGPPSTCFVSPRNRAVAYVSASRCGLVHAVERVLLHCCALCTMRLCRDARHLYLYVQVRLRSKEECSEVNSYTGHTSWTRDHDVLCDAGTVEVVEVQQANGTFQASLARLLVHLPINVLHDSRVSLLIVSHFCHF